MSDSLCRLTVASCTDDTHRAVDLTLPADIQIGQFLPQIVEFVHRNTVAPASGRDWRLSKLGDPPLDDSMTLNDRGVRDGDVLLLTIAEPPVAEWVECEPCRAMAEGVRAVDAPVLRILPAGCCVLLGGFGAGALAWRAAHVTTGHIVTGTCLAAGAAVGAAVVRRLRGDPLICVPLSLIAVLYAGAVGFLIVPPGRLAASLVLASAVTFSSAIVLQRMTGCGRTCLTAIATLGALSAATSAAAAMWTLQPTAGGAALVALSLAALGVAPRLSMLLSGTGPTTPSIDHSTAGRCHRTLTGLVVGSSLAAALGAASVAIGGLRGAGSALRDTTFAAVVALVLLLRVRTHVDPLRRVGLTAAAMLSAIAGFASAAATAPAHAHVVSALAATTGAAALGFLVTPPVSPVVLRSVEIVEYVALAAIVPMACWVGGIYTLALI
jgi:type VII secretion integral membrane protein EccD